MNTPARHSDPGRALAQAARADALVLQQCRHCHTVQYPPREICVNCLSDELHWKPVDNRGTVLAGSDLHHSLEPDYRQQLPWKLAAVQLDCGVRVLVHNRAAGAAGDRVRVLAQPDRQGNTLLVTAAIDEQEASP